MQLLDVLEMHPEFYIQFIQSSLQLAVTYNFTDSGSGLVDFIVDFSLLFFDPFICEEYVKTPLRIVHFRVTIVNVYSVGIWFLQDYCLKDSPSIRLIWSEAF